MRGWLSQHFFTASRDQFREFDNSTMKGLLGPRADRRAAAPSRASPSRENPLAFGAFVAHAFSGPCRHSCRHFRG